MRKLTTIVLGLFCLKASAQIPPEPECQVLCVEESVSVSTCLSTNYACLCRDSAYLTAADKCILATCSASDQVLARNFAVYFCNLYGVTLTTTSVSPATTIAVAVAATTYANAPGVGTSSITLGGQVGLSTITQGATPILTVVGGQTQSVLISPANTNSPSPSTSSPNNSSGGTNIGAIVGGVVGGIVGLAIIIGALFYVYYRGHRRGRNAVGVARDESPDDNRKDLEKDVVDPPVVVRRKEEAIGGRVRYNEETVEPVEPVEPDDIPSGRLNYPDLDIIGARTRDD